MTILPGPSRKPRGIRASGWELRGSQGPLPGPRGGKNRGGRGPAAAGAPPGTPRPCGARSKACAVLLKVSKDKRTLKFTEEGVGTHICAKRKREALSHARAATRKAAAKE